MIKIGVGLIGTGWVSDVHAHAFRQLDEARVVAVASRDADRGRAFAKRHDIARSYLDHRELVRDTAVDVVVIGVPNQLHMQIALDAAAEKKHVICEKPLATNLEDGQRMVEACARAGVMLAVAEELCFVPKFVRAKQILDAGGLGRPYQVHQREQHDGPHSRWFYERDLAGGGALLDMGVHGIEAARWVLGRPRAKSVFAHLSNRLHPDSVLEDHCTVLVEFDNDVLAVIEPSWALKGGMESHLDLFGTEGVLYTDLLRGTGMRMYSERAVETDPFHSLHWSTPDADWLWTNGYPQEMRHFLSCVRSGNPPLVGGEDGLAQLEICYAAYASAARGARVPLPFRPAGVDRAVDLWLEKR